MRRLLGIGGVCIKGGSGSGNFGHEGRPGQVGGSGDEGGGGGKEPAKQGEWKHSDLLSLKESFLDNGVTVSFDKSDKSKPDMIEMGNSIGMELTRLKQEYKDNKGRLQLTISSHSPDEATAGSYNWVTREMEVGKQPEQGVVGSLNSGPAAWSVDDSVSGTFRHEYGHHIYYRMGNAPQKTWEGIYNSKKLGWWAKSVSEYSETNPGEAFAESFARFSHKDYKGDLPSDVHDFMKTLRT